MTAAGGGNDIVAALAAAMSAALEPERDKDGPVNMVCLGDRGTANEWANANVAEDALVEMPGTMGAAKGFGAATVGDRSAWPDPDRDKLAVPALVGERCMLPTFLAATMSAMDACPIKTVLVGWLLLNDGRRECDGG